MWPASLPGEAVVRGCGAGRFLTLVLDVVRGIMSQAGVLLLASPPHVLRARVYASALPGGPCFLTARSKVLLYLEQAPFQRVTVGSWTPPGASGA